MKTFISSEPAWRRPIHEESPMKGSVSHFLAAALVGLASGLSGPASAGDPSPVGTINDNESIFIDGKTFHVVPGRAKGDASVQVKALDARELGPGAIVFRSGEKLYIVDAPLRLSSRGRDGLTTYVDADQERPNRIHI